MLEVLNMLDDEIQRGVAVGLASAYAAPLGIDIVQHIGAFRAISECNEQAILCTDTALATLRSAYDSRTRIAAGCPSGIEFLQTLDPQVVHVAFRLAPLLKSTVSS